MTVSQSPIVDNCSRTPHRPGLGSWVDLAITPTTVILSVSCANPSPLLSTESQSHHLSLVDRLGVTKPLFFPEPTFCPYHYLAVTLEQVAEPSWLGYLSIRSIAIKFWPHHLWLH